jgi:hypothetical protein
MSWTRILGTSLLASVVVALAGCQKVLPSVRTYADLPSRANGQYATLDESIKKQLVMKDSELQCSIDAEDNVKKSSSAACKCSESASSDWISDCSGWIGSHTPKPTP